jgi:hypothetical protein
VNSGGEAASIGLSCRRFLRWCLGCVVAAGLGVFVGDGAEHAVGGVAADGVVLVDERCDSPPGLLASGEAVLAEQFEFQGGVEGLGDRVVQCLSG